MVINTNKLNLEEQEKLAAVGHFWKTWGTVLAGSTAVALLAVAGWYGYGWYQGPQAVKATALYEQVVSDASTADADKLAASLKALQDGYGSTLQAQQAELLAARVFYEKGQLDKSQAALRAAAGRKADTGLQSTAKLQLAGLLIEQQQYDEAIKQLSGSMDPAYAALAADRMGDAYALQNKRQEAIDAYTKAFNLMDAAQPYRQMVAAKLGGFGMDAQALAQAGNASTAAPASPTTAKPAAAPASTATASTAQATAAPTASATAGNAAAPATATAASATQTAASAQ